MFPMESKKVEGDTFIYIDIDAIDNKNQVIRNPKKIEAKNAPSRASRKVFETSTLFSMVRPYLKNIAFVGNEYKDCIASTGFYVCTPLPFVEPKYLYLLLTSNFVVDSLNFFMKGDNSPSINGCNIENFYFPIPSLSTQRKVIKIIDELLPKIGNIQASYFELLDLTIKAKQKILEYYFGENSTYKSYYGNRILTTLKKLIPENKIGDGDWILSDDMDEKGEYALVQLKHIGNGIYNLNKSYNHINKEFFETNGCSEINANYILINRLIASNMSVCLLPNLGFKTITSVDVCWISPDNAYNQEYIMYYLLSPSFQQKVLVRGSGSTRKRISKKNLINIPINIHKINEQMLIANKIKEMFKILDSIVSQ